MMSSKRVQVQILDKDYQVACPPNERDALLSAAEELDVRMRQARNSGAVLGSDRLAVMVALNLCYELQQSKKNICSSPGTDEALKSMASQLDDALAMSEDV